MTIIGGQSLCLFLTLLLVPVSYSLAEEARERLRSPRGSGHRWRASPAGSPDVPPPSRDASDFSFEGRLTHDPTGAEDGARHSRPHAGPQGRHGEARTFDFEFEEVPTIIRAFRRMVRGLEFDISEMAITTYLCARRTESIHRIPVFPMRAFHHGAIVHNTKLGIPNPRISKAEVGVTAAIP